MSDIIGQYNRELKELNEVRSFFRKMQPESFDLKAMLNSLDHKINETEALISKFRISLSVDLHSCGICDRGFSEVELVTIGSIKICRICRDQGKKYLYSSDFEKRFDLPEGTIKRDCLSIHGKSPKLQPYIDCGLVNTEGSRKVVHEMVAELYYANPKLYRKRLRHS
jgi:hypothetical protein